MKKVRSIFYWVLLLLLLLVACSEDAAPTIYSGDTAEVRIASDLGANTADAAGALSTQGVPVDRETGESGVAKAVLEVINTSTDEQLFFKDGQVVSEAEGEAVTFTPEEGSVALALPSGTYNFLLSAFDDREPANELAFGLSEVEVGDTDVQVSITLSSFLGEVSFRVPESVEPNAVFDAFLEVSAPGRPDLRVPESDYLVGYTVSSASQVLSESKLGARVAAACEDIEITARYRRNGPRSIGEPSETRTTVPVRGGSCEGANSNVGADLVPPFVSITSPDEGADVDATFTLSGDVNDQQSGVDKVEVYEGTLKLGEAEVDEDAAAWTFDVSLEEGTYTLIVVAFDKAGNTSRDEARITVGGGNGGGDGGEETCTNPVDIPDENLEERLRRALELPEGAELTCDDLSELTELSLQNLDGLEADNVVTRLEGLQYAVNLERLKLFTRTFRSYDPYEDLEVISSLKKLTYFETDQSVDDLSFLAGAVNLETLILTSRFTQGVSNEYTDLTPLANLTNLRVLDLGSSSQGALADITPLADLTALENLNLSGNMVNDLTPLVANEGLGQGDAVDITNNPLETCPGSEDRRAINALLERGVEVAFSGPTDCQPDGGEETCTNPVDIPDENLRETIRGALGLSDDAELTCDNLAELTELTLFTTEPRRGPDTRVMRLEGLQFARNLERLVIGEDFRSSTPVEDLGVISSLKKLTYFETDLRLEDLFFLAGATALEEITLTAWRGGAALRFSTLDPLTDLTNLRVLDLTSAGNLEDCPKGLGNIADISALANLTKLENLSLSFNSVGDITPLIENEGLGEGDVVNLFGNPLEADPGGEDRQNIDALIERGVAVEFDTSEDCRDGSDGN